MKTDKIYNVHLIAIIQNIGQFYDVYGGRDKVDVFFQNTDYKIAYRQNTKTDQEFVSQQIGNHVVRNFSKSYRNTIEQSQSGSSESYFSKPLLTPDEVRIFSRDEGIVIFSGGMPVRYRKLRYYKDSKFTLRILPPVNIKFYSTG